MGIRFRILGSSSKGNAGLLISAEARVLVDAGFSARRLEALLQETGESLEGIDAIFLTHEHSDHAVGLRGLARRYQIPVFANRDTAEVVQRPLKYGLNWQLFETGTTFRFRDLEVMSFSIPHDAADPVGFLFQNGEGTLFSPRQSVAWVTDLGYAPKLVEEKIRHADILVLEANYDPQLLDESPRAWSLKQRIKGRHGHLSNQAALKLMDEVKDARWQQVYLAHLSQECNCPQLVETLFAPLRSERRIALSVVDPSGSLLPECVL